jgi:selenocysteine-specific elongation factor
MGTLVIADANGGTHEIRAQLHLREPVVVFPGLRFVLRRPSPMTLLGGGYVEGLDVMPSAETGDSCEEAVLAVLRDKRTEPVELGAVASAANLREGTARDALERLVERGDAIRVMRPAAYVDAAASGALLERMLGALETSHRQEPWALGMTSIALARVLAIPEPTFVRIAEHFVEAGRLINRGGYFSTTDHRPSLTPQQRAFFEDLVPVAEGQPFLPIPFASAATAVKLSHLAGLPKAFDTMLAEGALVKVGDDLYRGAQIARIRARLETHFGRHDRMTAAEFRDLLGTSRKYAVPLLEWLDARGITIRDGDYRRLRKAARLA